MWFECEQPFLLGERCVTSRKTAAKETTAWAEERPRRNSESRKCDAISSVLRPFSNLS